MARIRNECPWAGSVKVRQCIAYHASILRRWNSEHHIDWPRPVVQSVRNTQRHAQKAPRSKWTIETTTAMQGKHRIEEPNRLTVCNIHQSMTLCAALLKEITLSTWYADRATNPMSTASNCPSPYKTFLIFTGSWFRSMTRGENNMNEHMSAGKEWKVKEWLALVLTTKTSRMHFQIVFQTTIQ